MSTQPLAELLHLRYGEVSKPGPLFSHPFHKLLSPTGVIANPAGAGASLAAQFVEPQVHVHSTTINIRFFAHTNISIVGFGAAAADFMIPPRAAKVSRPCFGERFGLELPPPKGATRHFGWRMT